MGAMHNDLNRCNFMFSDDRRCRNLIHTPGAPFCYFHAKPRSKKPRPDSPADGAADHALFHWLAAHPLDSVTNVNHAVNLIACCSLASASPSAAPTPFSASSAWP